MTYRGAPFGLELFGELSNFLQAAVVLLLQLSVLRLGLLEGEKGPVDGLGSS